MHAVTRPLSTEMPSDEITVKSRVVQISNISPQALRDQIYTMFQYLGFIQEMRIYPSESNPAYANYDRRVCYLRYDDASAVDAALHMTNTVFIDRALICVPVPDEKIPDEMTALSEPPVVFPGQRQLPASIINQIAMVDDKQMLVTVDSQLSANGLPPYPPLSSNSDAGKIEEVRRTIFVENIPKEVKSDELLLFVNENIGEVKYLRMAGDENRDPSKSAYVELNQQQLIVGALSKNGIELKGNKLAIHHSDRPVRKPQMKTADAARMEVEDALRTASTSDSLVSRAADEELQRARSQHSRSRSPWFRRQTRRSPSPQPRRSRSRERYSRRRSRSKSRDRTSRRKERSSSKDWFMRRSRSRSPPHSKSTRRRSRSRGRRSHSKDRTSTKRKESRRSRSRERKRRKSKSKSASPGAEKKRKRSPTPEKKKKKREKESKKGTEASSSSKSKKKKTHSSRATSASPKVSSKQTSETPESTKKPLEEETAVVEPPAKKELSEDSSSSSSAED